MAANPIIQSYQTVKPGEELVTINLVNSELYGRWEEFAEQVGWDDIGDLYKMIAFELIDFFLESA